MNECEKRIKSCRHLFANRVFLALMHSTRLNENDVSVHTFTTSTISKTGKITKLRNIAVSKMRLCVKKSALGTCLHFLSSPMILSKKHPVKIETFFIKIRTKICFILETLGIPRRLKNPSAWWLLRRKTPKAYTAMRLTCIKWWSYIFFYPIHIGKGTGC